MNNRTLLLVLAVNIAVTACYVTVISAVTTVLASIVYIAIFGGTHIAVCCVAGVVLYIRGQTELAKDLFISAALLLLAPFVLMLL